MCSSPSSVLSFGKIEKPKVLVVDDNEIINNSNKKLVSDILEEKGFEFEIVELFDGLEIIKYILNHQIDYQNIKFILTDESLDFMNGSEAISFIRKLEKLKKLKPIKIVSSTCYENLLITENILNAGADMVLSKPVTKSQLIHILTKTFSEKI